MAPDGPLGPSEQLLMPQEYSAMPTRLYCCLLTQWTLECRENQERMALARFHSERSVGKHWTHFGVNPRANWHFELAQALSGSSKLYSPSQTPLQSDRAATE